MIKLAMMFLIALLVIVSIWLIGFWMVNDLSVKSKKVNFKNVLVIFPHPDDESLSCGGLLTKLANEKIKTNLIVLTKGEAGENYLGKGDLKEIRSIELEKSAKILGVENLILADFGDGKLKNKEKELKDFIDNQINTIKPDLIISYDLSGLYGHEDHIVVAKIITELVENKYNNIKLWYTTLPEKVFGMAGLPTHMAKNDDWILDRKLPNIKVFIGLNIIEKIKSVYAHKSQYNSFRQEEYKYFPLWFVYSGLVYEYFYENN